MVSSIPIGHYTLSTSPSTGFPEPLGERFDGKISLMAECSKVHSLHNVWLGISICSHLLCLCVLCFILIFKIFLFCFVLASIIDCHPKSLYYLALGSWSPKQCWIWIPSCGVGLQANQISGGYPESCVPPLH